MKRFTNTAFDEQLDIYPAERQYLNQEPNMAICYIDGVMIVRGDSGSLYFTSLTEEDKARFEFGSEVEENFLRPVSELPEAHREQLFQLNELNRTLEEKHLCAVALEQNDDEVSAIVTHIEHPENTYFRIAVPDLNRLTAAQIAELPEYNEERTLDDPYAVQLEDGQMIVY